VPLFPPILPIGSTLYSIVTLNAVIEASSLITWDPIKFSRFKRYEVGVGGCQCTRPHAFMHSSPQLSKVVSNHTMVTQSTISLIYGDFIHLKVLPSSSTSLRLFPTIGRKSCRVHPTVNEHVAAFHKHTSPAIEDGKEVVTFAHSYGGISDCASIEGQSAAEGNFAFGTLSRFSSSPAF
jgi:hypothetical protein